MPYHLSNVKRFFLVLFLGAGFLWTNRDKLDNLLCYQVATPNALVEFGPLPMMPNVPQLPGFPKEDELLLPQHEKLMEEQLKLREDFMKQIKEKTDR